MIIGGKEFGRELLQELEELGSKMSRRQLAQVVCERLGWHGPTGKPQWMSARKALAQLRRQGHLALPASEFVQPVARVIQKYAPPCQPLGDALDDLGQVRLVLIQGRKSQAAGTWKQLMAHHYLGAGPLCGAQLRYVIASDRGYLGALALSAAALKCQPRDQHIGWSPCARRHHLHRVVNHSRFLILPWVQVPNLASHVLGLLARQLAADWQQRYDYRPVLLETFVDQERFSGTCYQAAGWQCLGQSQGRGRQDRQHEQARSIKSIWIKALAPDWQAQLAQPPERLRFAVPAKPAPPQAAFSDWAEQEVRGAVLGDQRLNQRLLRLTRAFFARPQAQIPEACGTQASSKAAYRFFNHADVNLQQILTPHFAQTLERMQPHRVVLAVQDTTELDYTAHPMTQGLGPIGNHRAHVQGLMLHPTMVYTVQGVPLGLLQFQCWKRDPEHVIKFRKAVEKKESVKWLKSFAAAQQAQSACAQTLVVSVGDCEADMFELFALAVNNHQAGAKFLIRAFRQRTLEASPEEASPEELWQSLGQKPCAGQVEVSLPARGQRKARQATLQVRFARLAIQAPEYMKDAAGVSLSAVMLREENPPAEKGVEAVEWLLLTDLPVNSFEEAVEKSRWYAQRFQIEVYFRTLKTGCRIEDRQLGQARALENCLGIDLLVAWRITQLVKLGRQTPELPCTLYFEEMQWKALVAYTKKDPLALQSPPTLNAAIRMVAQLGGFLGRKSDGEPGTQTLWRGLQRLDDITIGFTIGCEMAAKARTVPSQKDYG